MITHVRVLGILNIIFGALGLLTALLLLFVFGGVAAAVSGDSDAAVALPIIGLTGMATVAFLAAWSLPCVIVGIGMYRLRPWARIAGIVVSILGLIAFPFGTALGIYGLWVLFSKDTEPLFRSVPATT